MNDTSFKTSLMEKIAYGMGDTACNVVFAITSSLIVYFYTNVIGMSAALVGTILLASRVFDGISDLLIAQIVDKSKLPEGQGSCVDTLDGRTLRYCLRADVLRAATFKHDGAGDLCIHHL